MEGRDKVLYVPLAKHRLRSRFDATKAFSHLRRAKSALVILSDKLELALR
jgi:hypothetical protein